MLCVYPLILLGLWFLHFSISFSRFLIILAITILNSFSGNLPISSSFFFGLLCFFTCAVLLCLFFLSFLFFSFFFWVIVFEVSFSLASKRVELFSWRRLTYFFLLVSALLRLVQWFVWALYRVRFVLSFCLFFLWWARLNYVVILSANDWVCIFILFVV